MRKKQASEVGSKFLRLFSPTWQCFFRRACNKNAQLYKGVQSTFSQHNSALQACMQGTTYVFLRPKCFVTHVRINNILQFQFFSQPHKSEIDFLISHSHKPVEVVSSQACSCSSAHALKISKKNRLHL